MVAVPVLMVAVPVLCSLVLLFSVLFSLVLSQETTPKLLVSSDWGQGG